MTAVDAPPASHDPQAKWLTWLCFAVGGLTLLRFLVVFTTPLELYPDEAQYWLWSRDLAFGYYSKPPMLAWLIALTTGVGGDQEPWVRFASPLLHAATALVLFRLGSRLYDARIGFWAGLLYSLMPGVMLSAGIASTDTPLLFFLSLALWAYVAFIQKPDWRAALAFGLALGGAFLSKYAALYALVGVALHLTISRQARQAWLGPHAVVAVAGLAAMMAPNLIWNALNDFSTLNHTAENANWHWDDLFNPIEALEFVASQLGVLGPIPFVVLIGGAIQAALRRRALTSADQLLLCFILPPLILVTLQALLSRANANWAAIAYAPACVLVAAWMVRASARRWLMAAVASQLLLGGVLMVLAASPTLADRLGASGSFKRVRGWEESATRVLDAAEAVGPRTVIAADDRFLFNALAYYGRDRLAGPDAPTLRMWVREARPHNQAETTAPLTSAEGERVLMASIEARFRHEFVADFTRFSGWTDATVRLDPERTRDLALGVGENYVRQPRDPETGEPLSPTQP